MENIHLSRRLDRLKSDIDSLMIDLVDEIESKEKDIKELKEEVEFLVSQIAGEDY